MKYKIKDCTTNKTYIVTATSKINAVKKLKDERLSPMTYKKLKELGVKPEQWKKWTQEEANKFIASRSKKEENSKKEKTEKEQSKKENISKELLQPTKYISSDMKAEVEKHIKKEAIELSKKYKSAYGWNNIIENGIWNNLKDKGFFNKKFPSNLYKIIREVIYKDKDVVKAFRE